MKMVYLIFLSIDSLKNILLISTLFLKAPIYTNFSIAIYREIVYEIFEYVSTLNQQNEVNIFLYYLIRLHAELSYKKNNLY